MLRKAGSIVKQFTYGVVLATLVGCKADMVEIVLSEESLFAAGNGQTSTVEFGATFSGGGELNADQRSQIREMEAILKEAMTLDDFDIESTDNGFSVEIEGELPLVPASETTDEPWYISVGKYDGFPDAYIVRVATSDSFPALSEKLEEVNALMAPNAFHPTTFRLKADQLRILAPAVQVEGNTHLFLDTEVATSESLLFSGTPFEETGAGFIFFDK